MKYRPIIGLEVHIELATESKMFCGCSTRYFGEKPNTHTCPVCLGLPGALPVPNKKAIEWCIKIAKALNCEINKISKFDRKNYFYPDLPKGYQISQYDQPFGENGKITVSKDKNSDETKTVRITRVHMEEDTAKLTHQLGSQKSEVKSQNYSLIDFNRSGVPLVEIVTQPDFENAEQVTEYLKKLQQIVRYLEVSNADMEKGEMRLEPNLSLATSNLQAADSKNQDSHKLPDISHLPSYKVEIKNINSFRFVSRAINFEINRQEKILAADKTPEQETRGWDEKKQQTVSQRSKEEAHDYRYFPEPDIPPLLFSAKELNAIILPELPDEKKERFQKDYGLNVYDSEVLTREKEMASFFEQTVADGERHALTPKQIANFIINRKIDIKNILPAEIVEEVKLTFQTQKVTEQDLDKAIKRVIEENMGVVDDYKKGKTQVIGFLIGNVKRLLPEKADIGQIKKALDEKLNSL